MLLDAATAHPEFVLLAVMAIYMTVTLQHVLFALLAAQYAVFQIPIPARPVLMELICQEQIVYLVIQNALLAMDQLLAVRAAYQENITMVDAFRVRTTASIALQTAHALLAKKDLLLLEAPVVNVHSHVRAVKPQILLNALHAALTFNFQVVPASLALRTA